MDAVNRLLHRSFGAASFYITLLDVFNALFRAIQNKFFDFDDFDVDEYEHYEVCFKFLCIFTCFACNFSKV